MIRSLCVRLGYIEADQQQFLGKIRDDVTHDPLELFLPCGTNPLQSRYQSLFIEDQTVSDPLWKLFFDNTMHNRAIDQGRLLLKRLEEFLADNLSHAEVLKSLLAGVQGIYNNKLRTPDRTMFTDDIAWSTLRLAWADSAYWMSYYELQLIGCHLGPEVRIYFHHTVSDGDDFFRTHQRPA